MTFITQIDLYTYKRRLVTKTPHTLGADVLPAAFYIREHSFQKMVRSGYAAWNAYLLNKLDDSHLTRSI